VVIESLGNPVEQILQVHRFASNKVYLKVRMSIPQGVNNDLLSSNHLELDLGTS
jgi:hypothetical protein